MTSPAPFCQGWRLRASSPSATLCPNCAAASAYSVLAVLRHWPLLSHSSQLLDKLPHTVRGMGMALLGGHQPIDFGEGLQQGKRHRLGNLAGFMVVVRGITQFVWFSFFFLPKRRAACLTVTLANPNRVDSSIFMHLHQLFPTFSALY